MTIHFSVSRFLQVGLSAFLVSVLGACASGSSGPKPADLGANPALLGVKTVWTSQIGKVDFPLSVHTTAATITVAGSAGVVTSMDSRTGAVLWRNNVGAPIAAGVGSDGRFSAVVTRGNELVTMEGERELWRSRLSSQVFTAPLVAGERVFVLGADREVSAFDARTGKKLWANQRPGEALVLRQSGVLLAVNNVLVVGLSGRLVGLNSLSGNVLWDAPLATPRGTNDIERLVDLVAGVGRESSVVCARAFQAAVGCVNAERGNILWKHPASGSVGLHADDKQVYGVEEDGKLMAWRLVDGVEAWSSDRLRYRQLTGPLVLGRSVVVGDSSGMLHFMSRTDGSPLTRLNTDTSGAASTPVVAGTTLVAVTRDGGVFGFQPD
ncbi:outer membrane protein assembly factor BamB [Rhodoferax antarcticus]|uniref:outer membrane protein assembly factor BamB n=1 Tax=Rhodoferax antarcticus TaxID=81479 RepID=UPI0009500674|nr:outer membrane protein assembly factor BamB [Rhodoferax antarcticus]APW46768.1 outer membrane protein assembly factor BamB [Rhodoferax antarcticus]